MSITDDLRRDEGWRSHPYTDTVGKVTIGCGRNLTDVGLSDAEILTLLQNDISKVTTQLNQNLPWWTTLSEPRQRVLLNMGFNLGIGGLLQFHDTLHHLQAGDWEAAATAMLASKWAHQVGARAQRLADLVRAG